MRPHPKKHSRPVEFLHRSGVFLLSELHCLGGFQLKLELVHNQGDELTIGGLSLGVTHCVTEEELQGIQIASVPGDLDGVSGHSSKLQIGCV